MGDRYNPSVELSSQISNPPDAPGVEFHAANKRGRADVRRVQVNALYFAAFGIWAVALAFSGEPLYGALAALVLFEMALAMLRISHLTGQVVIDPEVAERLTPILLDLCSEAGSTVPRVVFTRRTRFA